MRCVLEPIEVCSTQRGSLVAKKMQLIIMHEDSIPWVAKLSMKCWIKSENWYVSVCFFLKGHSQTITVNVGELVQVRNLRKIFRDLSVLKKNQSSFFFMKTMVRSHGKPCNLNFPWNILWHFFQGPHGEGQNF